jgi:CheY-like chemotaxis protein
MAETLEGWSAAEFERLVREALTNLFDQVALSTHPLAALTIRLGEAQPCRADSLRKALIDAIERLRPAGENEPCFGSPEWRCYLLLHGRYVEGASLQQLQASLSLSERQLRRAHSRAVQAVATLVWDLLFPNHGTAGAEPIDETVTAANFPVSLASLDIMELLQGVLSTLQRRAESEAAPLEVISPDNNLRVLSDRVILRQVLLSLLNYALDRREDGPVIITMEQRGSRLLLHIRFRLEDLALLEAEEEERVVNQACYWCDKIDICLSRNVYLTELGQLTLNLPSANDPLLLVVDDQETAFRMFQRYLSHTNLRLVGVRDGREVLPLARELQPQAITLDVMMPYMDGWEVLQNLQADPATRHIPVIICSVWQEPELANSLGAVDLLPKPIKQKDLLAALARLHLPGTGLHGL